jgi:hypothetical protein
MKNLKLLSLALLAVVALTIASCSPDEPDEPTAPKFTVTEINYTATANASEPELITKISIKNTSSEAITLHWVRQNVVIPTGWATAVCDHIQCYPVEVDEKDLPLDAGATIELKMNFYPDGIDGTGTCDLVIYDKADQTNTTGTYSFSATARP